MVARILDSFRKPDEHCAHNMRLYKLRRGWTTYQSVTLPGTTTFLNGRPCLALCQRALINPTTNPCRWIPCFVWHVAGLLRAPRSEEHTSELQSRPHLVCRLLLE